MNNSKLFGTAVVLLLLSQAANLFAQTPLEKLRLIYSAIGGSQASVWIPYETGIFRKHGLVFVSEVQVRIRLDSR